MRNERYDIIIIGSGAGGGTLAHALADSPARLLILERGDFVPQEDENWSPDAVWKDRRYQTQERWLDARGREFRPYTHYFVGGNTKFWGSVLFRLRREDFHAVQHVDGVSPAWPVDYHTLAPFYDRAERVYCVHGAHAVDPTEPPRGPFPCEPIPHAPRMSEIVDTLRQQGLHPFHLPLGIREGCVFCRTCNSFACKLHAKSEADVCCVRPAVERPNVNLWTGAYARRLLTNGSGSRVEAVEVEKDGETVRVESSIFIVSCGAVNSAALLLRSASDKHPTGLANASGLVGRRYMAHLATMLSGINFDVENDIDFQKTVAVNDFYWGGPDTNYPLGQIQSQGRTHAVMAQFGGPAWSLPLTRRLQRRWFEWYVARSIDWLVMTEDLPLADNRVTVARNGLIQLTYRPSNMRAHKRLIAATKRMLKPTGLRFPVPPISLGTNNTTHQCGTIVFGTDPRESVLDPYCRAHDVENLFVVDASFFPSSAAVNPALTIAAQALRVADHIRDHDL
jgi:choline dehydrogenase-like flavoprotein